MTSTGYSDFGEEWAHKLAFRQDQITRDTTLEVLLYDDGDDSLSDSSDVGAITTEPGDTNGGTVGNYARQTVTLDGSDVTLSVDPGQLRAEATVTFDTTDTTGSVDASAVVVDFQSDIVNSEGSQNPHHIYSSTLDIGSVDLTQFNNLQVTPRLDLS